MIKHVLFCGTLACAMVCQAAPQSRVGKLFGAHKQRTEMRAPASTVTKWLPGKVDVYYWGLEDWSLDDSQSQVYTYDKQGNVVTSTNAYEKNVNEYNSDNLPITHTTYSLGENGEEKLFRQTKFKYDDVVKDLVICRETTVYLADSDPVNQITRIDISRDKAGNVTSLEQYRFDSSMDMKELYLEAKMTLGYGADGKVNELKTYTRGESEDELEEDLWLKDIVWENTNGQIVTDDIEEFDMGSLIVGDNRLKAATLCSLYSSTMKMDFKIKYTGSGYEAEMIFGDIVVTRGTHKNTDLFGSFEEHFTETEIGMAPGGTLFEDGKSENTFIVTYDRFGLQLREYEYEKDDEGYEWFEEYRGVVTYDPTHGYPVEYVQSYRGTDMGEEFKNSSRKVFSNYTSVEVDGIEAVGAVDGNAPVEYFDLQGKRVANPTGGLFIRRQGGRATKVVL